MVSNLDFSRDENYPFKTCSGLKSLGYCHPDYPWAFQNGKMCCACGRQNQEQVKGKRFFAHCSIECPDSKICKNSYTSE